MIEIHFAQIDDAQQVGQLFFEDMVDQRIKVTLAEMQEVAERAIAGSLEESPSCVVWVARDDGDVVGVLLANFNWSLKFAGRAIWIEELYVTERARRQGLGRRLVDTLIDYAEDEALSGIDLEAYQGNTPASILYRSLGFHRLGRERFYYKTGGEYI